MIPPLPHTSMTDEFFHYGRCRNCQKDHDAFHVPAANVWLPLECPESEISAVDRFLVGAVAISLCVNRRTEILHDVEKHLKKSSRSIETLRKKAESMSSALLQWIHWQKQGE